MLVAKYMRRTHDGHVVQFTCTKLRWKVTLLDAAAAHLRCHPHICWEKFTGNHRQKTDLKPYEFKGEMLNNYAKISRGQDEK
jgi:hypothetical protein